MTYGYDGAEDAAQRKKKVAVIGVSSIILVAMVVAVAVGVNGDPNAGGSSAESSSANQISTSSKSIQAICQPTDYRQTCETSLTEAAGNTSDPHKLVQAGFQVAIDSLREAIKNSTTLREVAEDPMAKQALDNCEELMDDAIEDLKTSFKQVGDFDISKLDEYVANLKIWLSATITYQQTCLDGFDNTTGPAGQKMREILTLSSQLTSNGLAMVTGLSSILKDLSLAGLTGRRLLNDNGLPSWVTREKERILAETAATIKPDMTVAQDGSGQYKTINEAVKNIPKKRNTTFVLYIKAGIYKEQVTISRSMTHIMMIGDGPTKTKITGSLSYAGGVQTFKTSTVSVSGSHFIAKDIGFENTAGAIGHQAVALRVQSDMSIFYNCRMDGYQDTLYSHTYRQFYRDCTITGTIDFIFGDAAAVFQNCNLVVRRPLESQRCIITAQGRNNSRQATGFVIQNCTITAAPDYFPFRFRNAAYLGRPWRQYSRTIYMQSQIDDLIDPEGWMPWMGSFGLDTCSYSEYDNRGPGAVATKRVTWKGIKKVSPEEADGFTAAKFIDGDLWIPATGVPYTPGMIKL
ncbi:hypothetical protein P3X46_005929 [Hevea brasiliensis]|uniref:Pectinesterase n=1 Tax=Hevea brasiliensis TaxID=3981 RepID=A0ABQ9MSJ9_HEVBR|nr:putative pectinesterase/pectinesterase inhibitor 28 [Hevea brasiliensis]KAJ9181883.1 hypothetical protein P3X46_005929 [Hevea brasiliensis]